MADENRGTQALLRQPWLPLTITNPDPLIPDHLRSISTWGRVDTGADGIVVPQQMAERIGHDIPAGQLIPVEGVGGISDGFIHTCSIQVFGMSRRGEVANSPVIQIMAQEFAVMPNLKCILLGVKGFLEQYVLTVDYAEQRFCIKDPSTCCLRQTPPCVSTNA